jgi:orotate phosphoribosyltransferase
MALASNAPTWIQIQFIEGAGESVDVRMRPLEIIREKSYAKGEVTPTLGKKSRLYVDGKQTTLDSEGGSSAEKLFHEVIKRPKIPVEAVEGPTLGANPTVTAIFIVSYLETAPIPAFIIRKEPKKHGKSLWVEGNNNLKPGTNVAVVEGVVTTGESF